MALALAACGAPAADGGAAHGTTTTPTLVPAHGGTVTVALDQVPTTLNDHTVAGDTAAGRMIASAVWAQVFRVGPGATPQLDTNVVDSAEVVNLDPQTVVYQIDPRATWSDGVPIDADDFVYAWQSERGGALDTTGAPDSVATTLGYRDIASVTGSNGGKTVTVVFHTPFGDWASLFDDLLPAHVAGQVGWNDGFDAFGPAVEVSGGPWQVASFEPGVSIELVRNPHWWGSPASLDEVVVRALHGPALAAALRDGAVQVAYPSGFGPTLLAQVASSPTLQSTSNLGATVLQLEFNTRHAPLTTAAVRQAVAHDVDRAGLVTGVGEPENHLVWEDNDHLFANVEPGYDDDATGYEHPDPGAAAHLLDAAGLAQDATGTWSDHGAPVTLSLAWADDDPWSAAAGPVLAAQLVDAGFDVASEPTSSAQLLGTVLPSGDFDLAVVPVAASAYPSAMGTDFSSASSVTGGAPTQDWSGFDDAHVDQLFGQAAQQLGKPQALAVYRTLDQALWSAMPTLPLFAEPTLLVWSASVSLVADDPVGIGPLWDLRDWVTLTTATTAP